MLAVVPIVIDDGGAVLNEIATGGLGESVPLHALTANADKKISLGVIVSLIMRHAPCFATERIKDSSSCAR
jgi:hypothetical protein